MENFCNLILAELAKSKNVDDNQEKGILPVSKSEVILHKPPGSRDSSYSREVKTSVPNCHLEGVELKSSVCGSGVGLHVTY